ncbi:hypothetical protein GCM10010347_07710 [Streptomyces cirratus]|uniref:Uncharacterized protein n=1 Tax=Streptomyces cirratus TaxID=68187 RepID=A0ABQ3EME4_9ACTN|nr:hypothetical protein GCM10010347_07710 [Streptomyces cirratus]
MSAPQPAPYGRCIDREVIGRGANGQHSDEAHEPGGRSPLHAADVDRQCMNHTARNLYHKMFRRFYEDVAGVQVVSP